MLKEFFSNELNRTIQFHDKDLSNQNNIFTIIVGKNGIGKSRLLREVINYYLHSDKNIIPDQFPEKIIAVSTSAFDRFPLFRRELKNGLYQYNGVRSPIGTGVSRLINSVGYGLIQNYLYSNKKDRKRTEKIFGFLDFRDEFGLSIRVNYNKLLQIKENKDKDLIELRGLIETTMTRKEAEEALHIFDKLSNTFGLRKDITPGHDSGFEILFDNSERKCHFKGTKVDDETLKSILQLNQFNITSISDVNIQKKQIGDLSLRKASSGEQCIFSMIFSIAGSIKDNSLIIIDEPEISLHPEWQEKYIEILSDAFSHYKNCQFIIASHSPQIVSRLRAKNSYVLSLHLGELFSSEIFSKRSSDFLLAEIFDSPGYRNEYVTRIAINLFAKVKSKKKLDSKDLETISRLREFKKLLDVNDPVYDLIISVEEIHEFYK